PAALPAPHANNPGYAFQFSSLGGKPGADTWTISSGALPAGVTLTPAGFLSGTPTQTGSFPVTIKATDSNGTASTKSFTLTVNPTLFVLTGEGLPSGLLNQAYGPLQVGTTS